MHPEKFLEHFSNHLKNAIARSISLAGNFGNLEVAPIHLLLALGEEQGAIAGQILARFRYDAKAILKHFPSHTNKPHAGPNTTTLPELNTGAKQSLEKAMLAAYERSQSHVGTEHLLFGILASKDPSVEKMLDALHIDRRSLEDEVLSLLKNPSDAEDMVAMKNVMEQFHDFLHEDAPAATKQKKGKERREPSALDVFTVNLTDKHIQKTIDPVVGREAEIERMIRILCRRTKNNPVLVGEPGVGKTAIAEGLAKKIAEGAVPDILKKKKIFSLDLPLLLSGTIYRGEFEARLKQVIDELSLKEDSILFIDEIHNIIGAGGNQGTMDAANMLKPALARGLLRCIGATTLDEYQKHIADDPALERRFQSITVDEPSTEATVRILQGLAPYYEKFHGVRITDEAIRAAVEWSSRYIHEHFLPDKAIDLLDEASAAVRIAAKKALPTVTEKNIARIVAAAYAIPEERLLMNEWERLTEVEHDLRTVIVGQDQAIDDLMHGLRRASLGLGRDDRPLASFLFVGPSGVGKTAMTKTLAKALYHDEKALVRLDMTEFSEPHSVAKILGSPVGYVGYKERNHFLDELRRRPASILVFDEFDKAHPDVQKILFQILDEGRIRTSHGKQIAFRQTVVILTANIGEEFYKSPSIGFGASAAGSVDDSIRAKIKEQLGGALIDRMGATLLFRPLSADHMTTIVGNAFAAIAQQIQAEQHISIVPDKTVVEALATEALSPSAGVRHMERRVEGMLHDVAIDLLLDRKAKKKKQYVLTAVGGSFVLR